jgi:hypothetical protein
MRPAIRRSAITLTALLLAASTTHAERTPLLKVDLQTGKRQRIDREASRDRLDLELDALLDDATGSGFTTADLERIERSLRRFLRARRPRSAPRLLLFLYPGQITRARLKELREVVVDVDLLVDPCPRSVCRDSLGKHLEMLGKAMGKPRLRGRSYAIRFGTVSLRTSRDGRSGEALSFNFSAGSVIDASRERTGRKLVKAALGDRASYTRKMAKAITRRVRARGVRLQSAPSVLRDKGRVTVTLSIASDRVRYQTHVTATLVGAMQALRKSDITPSDVRLVVKASGVRRRGELEHFRCKGYPLSMHLDGRMGRRELWATYVLREQRGGQTLSFSEGETAAGGSNDARDAPDRTEEILAENFNRLAPCLQEEAMRRRSFSGVTLAFSIDGNGRAIGLRLTERRASGRLKRCLAAALKGIRFQRHSGAPRKVTYPMYIKR